NADLDDPWVVDYGVEMALWVTTRRANVTDIEHSDSFALEQGFLPLVQAILPDQSWEAGAVTGPSLIAGDPVVPGGVWVIFYAGGGAIGWATAPAVTLGHKFVKAPGPALLADGTDEGTELSSPAVVRLDDRVRVYYLAAGAIWAADAPWSDVVAGLATTWTRLDGDPATPERDPMLRAPTWASSIARFTARAGTTAANRVRHDLYFTAVTAPTAAQPSISTCGFASSFSGDRFATAAMPILPLAHATRAPAETPYRDGALLLYIERSGARDAVAAAHSP
ncbi:MAG: hypothetical protein JWM53_2071, partial [bacterium]|nr:hypothetical protein [bacterium]